MLWLDVFITPLSPGRYWREQSEIPGRVCVCVRMGGGGGGILNARLSPPDSSARCAAAWAITVSLIVRGKVTRQYSVHSQSTASQGQQITVPCSHFLSLFYFSHVHSILDSRGWWRRVLGGGGGAEQTVKLKKEKKLMDLSEKEILVSNWVLLCYSGWISMGKQIVFAFLCVCVVVFCVCLCVCVCVCVRVCVWMREWVCVCVVVVVV